MSGNLLPLLANARLTRESPLKLGKSFVPDVAHSRESLELEEQHGERAASPAAHLAAPVCSQGAFLLAHHLHAGHILFKCLHLNRGTFQNTRAPLTLAALQPFV